MRDRAGDRATLQPKPAYIANPDSSGRLVPLDAGDLEEVALDIGHRGIVDDDWGHLLHIGHDLAVVDHDGSGRVLWIEPERFEIERSPACIESSRKSGGWFAGRSITISPR